MTEQMAIEHAREFIKYMNHENWEKDFDAIQILINATEEIQQYKAIGTVEEFKMLKDHMWTLNEICRDYSSIGTVAELQALKEKSVAKKPIDISRVRDSDGYIGLVGKCPCCEDIVEEDTLYCDCGQHLDWE